MTNLDISLDLYASAIKKYSFGVFIYDALICKSSYFLSYSSNNIVKTGIKLLKSPLINIYNKGYGLHKNSKIVTKLENLPTMPSNYELKRLDEYRLHIILSIICYSTSTVLNKKVPFLLISN